MCVCVCVGGYVCGRDVRLETGASTRALQDRLAIFLARAVARRLRRAYGSFNVALPDSGGWWPDLQPAGPNAPGGAAPREGHLGWWAGAVAGALGRGADEPGDASHPRPAPRGSKGGKPRESKPLRGSPGGIYGPDGVRLPSNVFYLLAKKRYQSGIGQTKGANRQFLAEACADAALLQADRAPPSA